MIAPSCPALERCSSLQKETQLSYNTERMEGGSLRLHSRLAGEHTIYIQLTSSGGTDGDIPRLGFSLQDGLDSMRSTRSSITSSSTQLNHLAGHHGALTQRWSRENIQHHLSWADRPHHKKKTIAAQVEKTLWSRNRADEGLKTRRAGRKKGGWMVQLAATLMLVLLCTLFSWNEKKHIFFSIWWMNVAFLLASINIYFIFLTFTFFAWRRWCHDQEAAAATPNLLLL